jgi:iron complex transport system ATP-binding protein
MLEIDDLTVGYSGARGAVLRGLRMSAAAGSFICVLGRNGTGKSTLLRTVAGLQPALAGSVRLNGQAIAQLRPAERARHLAVVLTERTTTSGLRVDDVVALARQPFTGWRGGLTESDRNIVRDALAMTGVAGFANRFFDDLSDGERQRVMIARAIAQTPRLMVLDEITAFLDLPGRVEMMTLLRRHARANRTTVMLSSHDLDLSLRLADKVWLLESDGSIGTGTADELVARGAIGRAFDTEEVTFSAVLGRFELRETRTGPTATRTQRNVTPDSSTWEIHDA